MVRRSTSRSGSTLSRTKSTASVRSAVQDLEHISPADALRDAHVAATVSFARARDRAREYSTMSHPRHSFYDGVQYTAVGSGGELHHRRSVRFVKPAAGRRASGQTHRSDARPQAQGGPLPLNDLHFSKNQHLSRASSVCDVTGAQARADAYVRALQASEACYTAEDNIGSAPSSYRRLRKSKSMLTPASVSTADHYTDHRSYSSNNNNNNNNHQGFRSYTLRPDISNDKENWRPSRTSHQLRTPKSMSFLKSRPDIPVRRFIQQENEAAVEMARDMFRKTAQQQERLKSYPSRLFRSRSKPGDMYSDIRGPMRSSSTGTNPFSLTSSSLSISRGSVRSKVRNVSSNLKTKLKKLLNLNKNNGEGSLSEGIGGLHQTSIGPENPCDQGTDNSPVPYQAQGPADYTLSFVASRMPSFREVPGSLKSRQCSLESLRSDHRAMADGYRGNTCTNPGLEAAPDTDTRDWEHHRLSVIKEHANHSSSANCKNPTYTSDDSSHLDNMATVPGGVLPMPGPIASGERVYSALMRRQLERSARNESSSGTNNILPPPAEHPFETHCPITPTIRCVEPDDDVFVDNFRAPRQPDSRDSTLRGSRHSSTGSVVRKPLPPSSHFRSLQGTGATVISSPHDHLFRTGSPYRRTLQEAMRAANNMAPDTPGVDYMPSMSDISLPLRCLSAQDDNRRDYTSSVYSSTPASPWGLPDDIRGEETEPYLSPSFANATMLATGSAYQSPLQTGRMASDASSVEWKTWLSSTAMKAEDPDWAGALPGYHVSKGSDLPGTSGHIREGEEVDSSDTGLSTVASTTCSPRQTMEMSSQCLHVSPNADDQVVSPSSLPVSCPNENEPPGPAIVAREPASPPPPIPERSGLRPIPSLPCVRTPSIRPKGRSPKSVPRQSSFKAAAPMALKRRPGIRLARKARAGLRPSATLSCLSNAPKDTASADEKLGTPISSSLPSTPARSAGEIGEATRHLGSKEMVDIFLSKRRTRIAGSDEGDAFV